MSSAARAVAGVFVRPTMLPPSGIIGYDAAMLPLADAPTYVQAVVPIYSLDGMTLLLGAFFLYCLAHPDRVRNRTHYWAAFACLLFIILFYVLRLMLYNSPAGQVFSGVMIGMLQAMGLVLTVMYVGGLRPSEVASELRDATDDFRRGGEPAKPVIIPLTGEQPKAKEEPIAPPPPRVVIDLPKATPDGRLPLE
ncbi:MAG: hypothetical protein JWM57_42 [Phycisphaerales bacterium]|nr:hypothetical protein [Phycisphaerales bacterium]